MEATSFLHGWFAIIIHAERLYSSTFGVTEVHLRNVHFERSCGAIQHLCPLQYVVRMIASHKWDGMRMLVAISFF